MKHKYYFDYQIHDKELNLNKYSYNSNHNVNFQKSSKIIVEMLAIMDSARKILIKLSWLHGMHQKNIFNKLQGGHPV